MPMTPWAYTGDLAVQFNMARFLLGETDPTTAILTDLEISSALALTWLPGMAVLAQNLLVRIDAMVSQTQEQGAASYTWDPKIRRLAIQAVKTQADNGTLPDPAATQKMVQGSITTANAPAW